MPDWFNRVVTVLLRVPVLHRLMSGSTLLLSFTGRTTGRRYTTPVVYLSQDDGATLLVTTDSRWARNLSGTAPVQVRLRGQDRPATATTSADPTEVRDALAALVTSYPRRYGRAAGVRLGRGRVPDPGDLERAASSGRTLVRITLDR